MTDKEKIIKELKEVLDSLDITNEYRLNLIKAIEYLQEESASDDLDEEIRQQHRCFREIDMLVFEDIARHFAEWQREKLWKDAQGGNLPEIYKEVIVLTQDYSLYFAHRPNPNGWDGKSITTDKVEHYTPKTYDKGGWNIPNVKYWLDADLPNMED